MLVAPRNAPPQCCEHDARKKDKDTFIGCGICLSTGQNAHTSSKKNSPRSETRPLKKDPTTIVCKTSVPMTCIPAPIKTQEQQSHKALVSCLRTCSKETHHPSRRRVRGLWNPACSCLFSNLHDDALLLSMSYLSMKDLLNASMVCRRWKHCALHESSWKVVDATDFVQEATHDFHATTQCDAIKATSQSLSKHLEHHKVQSLTVRSIEHRLNPNIFLPSLTSMVQLTLTGYANLTDTHVQVMFVSSKVNILRKLALEQCPLLTNATVQSISLHCTNLRELSLGGNTSITELVSLQNRLDTLKASKTTCLQSLFAPTATAAPSGGTNGALHCINIVRTGVSAAAVVTALHTTRAQVRIERLAMDGDTWNDQHLSEFTSVIDLDGLECLEIGCADRFSGSTRITDTGLMTVKGPLGPLRCINLAGHKAVTASGIARLLLSAPNIEVIDLEGCKGLVSGSDAQKGVFALTCAVSRLARLKRLVLCRCFQSRKESIADPVSFAEEEELGRMLLTALCRNAQHLQELDVSGCYFVTQADVDMLRKKCSGLETARAIRTGGTRCFA